MCQAAFGKPSEACDSSTTSERMPWMRLRISWVKPAMTLLTTIIVATPSITLIMDASAIYRVRRYRQQSRILYM